MTQEEEASAHGFVVGTVCSYVGQTESWLLIIVSVASD